MRYKKILTIVLVALSVFLVACSNESREEAVQETVAEESIQESLYMNYQDGRTNYVTVFHDDQKAYKLHLKTLISLEDANMIGSDEEIENHIQLMETQANALLTTLEGLTLDLNRDGTMLVYDIDVDLEDTNQSSVEFLNKTFGVDIIDGSTDFDDLEQTILSRSFIKQ